MINFYLNESVDKNDPISARGRLSKPNLDCIYTFKIDFAQKRIPFGAKLSGNVENYAETNIKKSQNFIYFKNIQKCFYFCIHHAFLAELNQNLDIYYASNQNLVILCK